MLRDQRCGAASRKETVPPSCGGNRFGNKSFLTSGDKGERVKGFALARENGVESMAGSHASVPAIRTKCDVLRHDIRKGPVGPQVSSPGFDPSCPSSHSSVYDRI